MDIPQFANLLRQHQGLIHKVAYAYCARASDRDDVMQEIAIQLWRAWERYDASYKESTWVYRVAINAAISFHRRERRHNNRRVSLEAEAIIIAAPIEKPTDDWEVLSRCIEQLSELDKALVLLYLEGYDHASIAEVLGITITNVGTKLQRVKKKLAAGWERRFDPNPPIEPHSGEM